MSFSYALSNPSIFFQNQGNSPGVRRTLEEIAAGLQDLADKLKKEVKDISDRETQASEGEGESKE